MSSGRLRPTEGVQHPSRTPTPRGGRRAPSAVLVVGALTVVTLVGSPSWPPGSRTPPFGATTVEPFVVVFGSTLVAAIVSVLAAYRMESPATRCVPGPGLASLWPVRREQRTNPVAQDRGHVAGRSSGESQRGPGACRCPTAPESGPAEQVG